MCYENPSLGVARVRTSLVNSLVEKLRSSDFEMANFVKVLGMLLCVVIVQPVATCSTMSLILCMELANFEDF